MFRIAGRSRLLLVAALAVPLAVATTSRGAQSADEPGTRPDTAAPALAASARVAEAQPVAPFVAASGAVSLSVDATGTNASGGSLVTVEKPANATVRNAYLIAASRGFSNYVPADGDIELGGVDVNFEPARTMATGIGSFNAFADVTDMVRNAIDGAAAGPVLFRVDEGSATFQIDGVVLAVIFDDPGVDVATTVILAYGAQQVTGDRIRLARPAGDPDADVDVTLGVGISFGFQPSSQDNTINVNGVRLSTSAGGQDDGEAANGALITVGGVGDDRSNPADPFQRGSASTCPRCDDELYDLSSFVAGGVTTELELTTTNPSADDNFFFASLLVEGATATWQPSFRRPPVVVLHGITGAYLEDETGAERWPDEGRTLDLFDDNHLNVLKLADNGIDPANPDDQISVSTSRGYEGIIGQSELCTPIGCKNVGDAYNIFFETMQDDYGYVLGTDLFPFAFDWRHSAARNGALLNDRIDEILAETGAPAVNIIAHSQGGLVMRNAVEDPRSVGKIQRIVTLGTPNLGATKLLGVLDYRQPCQSEPPGFIPGCILNRAKAQELVTNWTGALELLPSVSFYDMYGSAVQREIDDDGDGNVEGDLEWFEVRAQLNDRNIRLIDEALNLHQQIDEWDPADPDVELLRFVGTRSTTILKIRQFEVELCRGSLWWRDCDLVETFDFIKGDGDGTVPRSSASLNSNGLDRPAPLDLGGGAPNCLIWGDGAGHGELPNSSLVLSITVPFLEDGENFCGRDDEIPAGGAASRSLQATTSAAAAPASTGTESPPLSATELLLRGPLVGALTRAGSGGDDVLGTVELFGRQVETEAMPGGTYTTAPNSASFAVTVDGQYDGTWTATAAGQFQPVVRRFVGDVDAVLTSAPIAIPEGAIVSTSFHHPVGDDVTIEIDDDADGVTDRLVELTLSVSGDAAGDTASPSSDVALRRFVADGEELVEVTIEATDRGGSGVAAIDVGIDATGDTFEYSGPFVVPALGELYVRARDRAGNVEAPHQVVVLDDHPSRRDLVTEFRRPHFNDNAHLGYPGDVDQWGVEIVESGRYRFKLIGLQLDYDLQLVDAAGNTVAISERAGSTSETITVDLEPGRFFLTVTGADGAWSGDHDYRVLGVGLG